MWHDQAQLVGTCQRTTGIVSGHMSTYDRHSQHSTWHANSVEVVWWQTRGPTMGYHVAPHGWPLRTNQKFKLRGFVGSNPHPLSYIPTL